MAEGLCGSYAPGTAMTAPLDLEGVPQMLTLVEDVR